MPREALCELIKSFSPEALVTFLRRKSSNFRQISQTYADISREQFRDVAKVGEINFADTAESKLIVVTAQVLKPLSEHSGKKAQYELGRKILAQGFYDAGIFVFYDAQGLFRFSLIYPQYVGRKKQWSNFRRFTYLVHPQLPNKTFIKQIADGDFLTLDKVKESFSLAKVTNDFYGEFKDKFEKLIEEVTANHGKQGVKVITDFALLFVIRIIFLGFIQKRGWIGNDEKFLLSFLAEYTKKGFGRDLFYSKWLKPLFFEALNSAPGSKVAYGNNEFPASIEQALQMAPYLNGGLFQPRELDELDLNISDSGVKEFFDFLFSYNFTIEENTLYDADLELNPEFLGVIFERLVNKENGAVYTPRTEVDFMCRIALVKWLEKNNATKVALKDLYELFFSEGGPDASEDSQRRGDFTAVQKKELIDLLETVTVCDPAVGSGAFLVGMLHVLDDVEQELRGRIRDSSYRLDAFERKQRIINRSLYGVEVKEWAVWITQLRLWITLFIDAPDSMRSSFDPILPSLDFKVRQGDSLVQRVGKKMFPVSGHANIAVPVKAKVTRLKELKADFFQNKQKDPWRIRQEELKVFRSILNAEIDVKRQELNDIRGGDVEKQLTLDCASKKSNQQQELRFNDDRIKVLDADIVELEEELSSLSVSEKPLVWNIEFAEVFVDKGGFDIIIGNPPYVRQEAIADPLGKIKEAKKYKNYLAEMVAGDFPREFKKEKLNAKSDLYTYFYIRSLRLLNEKGIHVFICSHSWLDVGYGVWLQKFLLHYAPIHFIFYNNAKRSFAAADVNTIISVIGAPIKKVLPDHMVKFVAFKLPFEETIFTENLLEVERARAVTANEKFRVYPISDEELINGGVEVGDGLKGIGSAGKYIGDKWGGKYLRAPDVFFTILNKGKGKLVFLSDVADVRFGIKTGANDFFYLTDERISQFGIESKFFKKTIFSFKEIKSIEQKNIDFRFLLFWCPFQRKDIKGTNALKYIEWGERQTIVIKQGTGKNKKVTGYQNLESCSSRKLWYGFPENWQPADLIINSKVGERFLVYKNEYDFFEDKKLYGIFSKNKKNYLALTFLLNSTLSRLFLEIFSAQLTGAQAIIDVTVDVVKRLPILDVEIFNFSKIDVSFLARPIGSIFEECGLNKNKPIREQEIKLFSDRKKLDDVIFDAIGLTENERKEVYWSVCELVKNRLDKAGSV